MPRSLLHFVFAPLPPLPPHTQNTSLAYKFRGITQALLRSGVMACLLPHAGVFELGQHSNVSGFREGGLLVTI